MAERNYIADIKDLLLELRDITILAMAQSGIKETSELSKSVQYVFTKDGIQMKVAEYYPFVSEGHIVKRRARTSKVPLDALIQWIKKKGIVGRSTKSGRFISVNQLAFAIQMSIFKKGINSKRRAAGKKFAEKVANSVADYTSEELANLLANEIADELVEMFAPVAV